MATYLVTGGAGFIGSHLGDELMRRGHQVRVLDRLDPQVHGKATARPDYLAAEIELVAADVCDRAAVRAALEGVDGVFHLAARVGVGQSMYQIDDYTAVNDLGTAVLLQELIERPVGRLVVASSMSVYGEGMYRDSEGRAVYDAVRDGRNAGTKGWDPVDAEGRALVPLPTPETKPVNLSSVYALGKYVQEQMCLLVARAYGFEAAALRLFNVYGTRQALSNPYTGVLAIFASRLLNGRQPLVFEDGRQRRDFVHVADVARAFRLAMETPGANGGVFNVGSGHSVTVAEVAKQMARHMQRPDLTPQITGKVRTGDIRHCFADIGRARQILEFEPRHALEDGFGDMLDWLSTAVAVDNVDRATGELAARGLVA